MKTLYLDCTMGVAGDMLAAALLSVMDDPAAALADLNALGLPGVVYAPESVSRAGIAATHMAVRVHGEEEGACPGVRHGHAAHHHTVHAHEPHAHEAHAHEAHVHEPHAHHTLADILHLLDHLALPQTIKAQAADVYRALAAAEGRVHGREPALVHFHEVGAMDAVADIVAVCVLMARLEVGAVVSSPVNTGGGTVRCAHGVLPVPAPATALLLADMPSFGDAPAYGELCTPTGAALVRHFAQRFGPQPLMKTSRIGYGAGRKDFADRANVVRVILGETAETAAPSDEVWELSCQIDDMTGEALAFACEALFAAGACDVVTLPAGMKKGRAGVMVQALCAPEAHDAVVSAFFRHTTTLGVRETLCRRQLLARREVAHTLEDGTPVRIKHAHGWRTSRAKYAYEDAAAYARAHGVPLAEAYEHFEVHLKEERKKK